MFLFGANVFSVFAEKFEQKIKQKDFILSGFYCKLGAWSTVSQENARSTCKNEIKFCSKDICKRVFEQNLKEKNSSK